MRNRRYPILTFPLALLFAIQVLLSPPALAGLTLCIGENGHMHLESKADDCCPLPVTTEHETGFTSQSTECESCLDVDFGVHGSGPLIQPGTVLNGLFFAATVILDHYKASLAPSPARYGRQPPVVASPMTLQSVVLRV